MEQIQSCKQYHVYNNSHVDVFFEILKKMKFIWNTKHAARKTQIDRQVEKKTYTAKRLMKTGKQTRSMRQGNRGYYW